MSDPADLTPTDDLTVFAVKGANTLRDVEIFRVGEWNGREFTDEDITDILAAYGEVGYRVPVKLGHDDQEGGRAWGWVENLRRVGDRLVADLTDIADGVYATIKEHGYDAVSSEIYMNLKRGGTTFRRALKAVALLGAEPPAVAGLKPLRESLNQFSFEGVANLQLKGNKMSGTPTITDAELEALQARATEADRLAVDLAALQEKHRDDSTALLRTVALEAQIAELKQVNATAEAQRRRERITAQVAELSIPALRGHFESLLDLASRSTETVKFTVGDAEADIDASALVMDLMRQVDKHSAKLFSQVGKVGDSDRFATTETDPGAELLALAQEHAKLHNMTRDEAERAVNSDPKNADLVRRYARRA